MAVRPSLCSKALELGSDIAFIDTPWDEPTQHSVEYVRFVEGVFMDDDPWDRMEKNTMCRLEKLHLVDTGVLTSIQR